MPVYALDDLIPVIDPEAYVHPDAVVIGAVELAAGSSVWPSAVLRGDHGFIKVGERTSVQDGTIVHTTHDWPTVIGANCVVGHGAHLAQQVEVRAGEGAVAAHVGHDVASTTVGVEPGQYVEQFAAAFRAPAAR